MLFRGPSYHYLRVKFQEEFSTNSNNVDFEGIIVMVGTLLGDWRPPMVHLHPSRPAALGLQMDHCRAPITQVGRQPL